MIPGWLLEKLRNPPKAGAGIHAWLYSVARQCHAHMGPDEIFQRLKAATAWSGRRVTDREITDAVQNSLGTAWVPRERTYEALVTETVHRVPVERWPKCCPNAVRCALADGGSEVPSLADLWERSPIRWDADVGAEDVVRQLFPIDEESFLCCSTGGPEKAETKRLKHWSFAMDDCQFVVPSPMSKARGARKDGKGSARCLANTGPRRYLVVEFDSGTFDEHAALLWHLDRGSRVTGGPRLCMAVHSGGKSLHGWFLADGRSEDDLRSWFSYAVLCGADPATFTPCQLVRMPEGRRDNGCRQAVYFFNPEFLWTLSRSSPPSEASGSPPQSLPPVSSPSAGADRISVLLAKRRAAAAVA